MALISIVQTTQDPVHYLVGPALEFLQERFTAGAAARLNVYIAAIAAEHVTSAIKHIDNEWKLNQL